MTPVGPATEAGAPVVPSAPKNVSERLEYLVRLAGQVFHRFHDPTRDGSWSEIANERMAQAAQAWELEVAEASEESREMLAIAHDRVAQLEQTVERLSVDLDEARQNAQAASERHAIESGEQRQTIAALAAQLVREMQRGGGA